MTTPTPALNAALAKVQAKLPKLERDRTVEVTQKNGQTYSYSYATLANLSDAVLPLLTENGLAFVAMPGAGSDGKMCLNYSLRHESGEALSGEFPLSAEGGIQVLGGRITYARRYCLAAVTGIAADEDDESRLSDDGPRPAQRAQRPRQRAASPTPQQGETAQRSTPPASARPPLPGEEAPPPEPITKPQLTKIQTVFSAISYEGRDNRLFAASAIVGRPLMSSTELTKDEARALIDTLDRIAGQENPAEKLDALVAQMRPDRPVGPDEGSA